MAPPPEEMPQIQKEKIDAINEPTQTKVMAIRNFISNHKVKIIIALVILIIIVLAYLWWSSRKKPAAEEEGEIPPDVPPREPMKAKRSTKQESGKSQAEKQKQESTKALDDIISAAKAAREPQRKSEPKCEYIDPPEEDDVPAVETSAEVEQSNAEEPAITSVNAIAVVVPSMSSLMSLGEAVNEQQHKSYIEEIIEDAESDTTGQENTDNNEDSYITEDEKVVDDSKKGICKGKRNDGQPCNAKAFINGYCRHHA